MARNILIIGKSGSGKSTSLRNFDNKEYALINVLGKDLPFRNTKKYVKTFNYNEIKSSLLGYANAGVKTIVIDDSGYLLTNALMTMPDGTDQYKHYRNMATEYYDLLSFIEHELPKDINVGVFMHEELDEFGNIKVKTVGKMLDNQVTIEGLFTIVLRAQQTSEGYKFQTQGDSSTIVKAPMGMFNEKYIDNDFKLVVDTINEYYNTEEVK